MACNGVQWRIQLDDILTLHSGQTHARSRRARYPEVPRRQWAGQQQNFVTCAPYGQVQRLKTRMCEGETDCDSPSDRAKQQRSHPYVWRTRHDSGPRPPRYSDNEIDNPRSGLIVKGEIWIDELCLPERFEVLCSLIA